MPAEIGKEMPAGAGGWLCLDLPAWSWDHVRRGDAHPVQGVNAKPVVNLRSEKAHGDRASQARDSGPLSLLDVSRLATPLLGVLRL
jgi:hypothetical protein